MIKQEDKVPRVMWKMNLLQRAMDTWGVDAQMDMVVEECAELIMAIQHYKRNRVDINKIGEEMADVKIMIDQFHTIDALSNTIHIKEMEKLTRLKERLDAHDAKVKT